MGGKGSGRRNVRADMIDPDFNMRSINFSLALRALPKINLGSIEEVRERIDLFFQMCKDYGIRPLMGNYTYALGLSKAEFWQLLNGQRSGAKLGITTFTLQEIKDTYTLIESNFEQLLSEAKNPVPSIFYAKSQLGWREAPNETIITHRSESPQLTGGTAEQIAEKYKAIAGVEEEPVYELPSGEEEEQEEAR